MAEDDDTYHVTEGDVAWVQEHMQLNHHKQVTREQAIKILNRLNARQKALEDHDPEAIEEILQDLEDY